MVAFGEAMIRLSPPGHGRLESATALDVDVGGAELNTAAALARFGTRVSWVSALPDNPLGRLVEARARAAGVDVSDVVRVPGGRCGLYFLEHGAAPRGGQVVYDRADSAIARLPAEAIDWPAVLAGAGLLVAGGITPALSETARRNVGRALDAARDAGVPVSFDVNYRSKLWSPGPAAAVVTSLSDRIGVLFTTPESARQIHGVTGDGEPALAAALMERFGVRIVAFTRREADTPRSTRFGGAAYSRSGSVVSRMHDVQVVDRVGAGDAFVGGFLAELLASEEGRAGGGVAAGQRAVPAEWERAGVLQRAVETGAALAALAHTVPGDFAPFEPDEVASVAGGSAARLAR